MAAARAAGAAAGLGGAATATASSSGKGGGMASAGGQILRTIVPRSTTPAQPWPALISSVSSSSSLERSLSRSFYVAGQNGQANAASQLDNATTAEDELMTEEDSTIQPAPEPSIAALMADVANLIKLVDSRDIVELELKSKEYEIVIRKEAQEPRPSPLTYPGTHVMAHTSFPGYAQAPSPPSPAPVMAVPEPPRPAAAAATPPPARPSCPPMLSPMAGTFYRSPAPGESVFVQVGDKVTKGQVVCIVEAMKLMNEIEADQSGTILEILAEDGKPISIGSPLFQIES